MFPKMFIDRVDAGRLLAAKLGQSTLIKQLAQVTPLCVLALPRGGVPVGYQVAQALRLPFDVFVVRKLGLPGHEELAMGAIASAGVLVLNEDVIRHAAISRASFDEVVAREKLELERRERQYRAGRPALAISGRACVVVDDGIATGASMLAAVKSLRAGGASAVIVAAPVAAPSVFEQFAGVADATICLLTPADFNSVGAWYEDFSQTDDREVASFLRAARDGAVESA